MTKQERLIRHQLADLRERWRYWKNGAAADWCGAFVRCPAESGIGPCPGPTCEGCASALHLQDRMDEVKSEAAAIELAAAAAGIDLHPKRVKAMPKPKQLALTI
jgi:hypothetical protein